MKQAKITFLTRFYPPNPNVNGKEVRDMAYYLEENHGIASNIITVDRELDRGGVSKRSPVGNVIRLKTRFKGEGKLTKMIAMLYDGYLMARHSLKYKDTFIIVTSSPPLLPFWVSLFYGKKMRWSFWTLDLFPEGLAASGYINKKNPLYGFFKRKTYRATPSHIIALGPKQAEHVLKEFGKPIPISIHPCGVHVTPEKGTDTPEWHDAHKITLGYCGNLNDAHNASFLKAIINHINPEQQQLILSLYGNQADQIKTYAAGKPGVHVVSFADRLDLIDIHLVSLITSWTHIAVPSKAMSAISMGCTILFCGSEESDIWHLFQDAGWLIDESGNIENQVADYLKALSLETIQAKKAKTGAIHEGLKKNVMDTHEELVGMLG